MSFTFIKRAPIGSPTLLAIAWKASTTCPPSSTLSNCRAFRSRFVSNLTPRGPCWRIDMTNSSPSSSSTWLSISTSSDVFSVGRSLVVEWDGGCSFEPAAKPSKSIDPSAIPSSNCTISSIEVVFGDVGGFEKVNCIGLLRDLSNFSAPSAPILLVSMSFTFIKRAPIGSPTLLAIAWKASTTCPPSSTLSNCRAFRSRFVSNLTPRGPCWRIDMTNSSPSSSSSSYSSSDIFSVGRSLVNTCVDMGAPFCSGKKVEWDGGCFTIGSGCTFLLPKDKAEDRVLDFVSFFVSLFASLFASFFVSFFLWLRFVKWASKSWRHFNSCLSLKTRTHDVISLFSSSSFWSSISFSNWISTFPLRLSQSSSNSFSFCFSGIVKS